jgi:hypothetical protein
MARATFGTAINCIDGRVQQPVAAWLRDRFGFEYVDTITEPGADALVATRPDLAHSVVRPKVLLSVERHASPVVAITAHHDCLANPVSEEEHRDHLLRAASTLRSWSLGVKIIALWVNERWQIDVVLTRG